MIFSFAIIIHNSFVIYQRSSDIIHSINDIIASQNFHASPIQRGQIHKDEDKGFKPGACNFKAKLLLGFLV